MKSSELRDIERQLGATAPPGLTALGTDALKQLGDALHDARKAQRRQMAAATESSLQHVPFLLRGAVKKVLGIK